MILSEAQAKKIYQTEIYEFNGTTGTIMELMKIHGTRDLYAGVKTSRPQNRFARENTIRRIRLGWSIEDILTKPYTYLRLEDEIVTYNGVEDEARFIAEDLHIPLSVLISRMSWELPLSAVFSCA